MNIFKNKTILIFGGTGSFGQAFLNKILKSSANEVRIFSRDEKKQDDLRNKIKSKKVKFYIGDIRDKDSVFESTRDVDFAFHAAALKQVPSCEFYPLEAIKTNILGTQNIIDCCIENRIKKLVCLSTDKAVYPINAMGMTKALMEKISISSSKKIKNFNTKIMITRYGNVLFSRGSVLPLFIKQIINKEFITVTDPTMTRFLMSLDEAINLVLFALQSGKNGNIYIPKTPATTIKILADSLIDIYDYPRSKIKIIGTRHGEKIHETLMSREENFFSKNHGKYFSIQSDSRELNYDSYFRIGKKNIKECNDYTSQNTHQLNKLQTVKLLKPLIKNLEIF
jgi:UDP-glucose 4-epimerase